MARKSGYPDSYGRPTKALPDVLGPLNIDEEGDSFVPPNDMADVADGMAKGTECPDPMGFLKGLK